MRFVSLTPKPALRDPEGERVSREAARDLGLETGAVRHARLYVFADAPPELEAFADLALADPVQHDVAIDRIVLDGAAAWVLVAKLPGVTDDEGRSAELALADFSNRAPSATQRLFSQDLYLFDRALDDVTLSRIANTLLANPLLHRVAIGRGDPPCIVAPVERVAANPTTYTVDLALPDDALLALSHQRLWALDLAELRAIRAHFDDASSRAARREAGMPEAPTDCELEIFAQTWSEHCKHKEFRAEITFTDGDTGAQRTVDGLFDTFIRRSTMAIGERLAEGGHSWLLKVFDDNAGVVRIDADRLFVLKVETHNSPSALDPYGGALTGILGNNRDPLGTGRGGARLLFNTNVLCFGPPSYARPLLTGQLHPARVMRGVRAGIEDGGNKSGVPTVNGALVFDERYAGKPLVYCGTGAVLPARYGAANAWEKEVLPGDRIVVAGGRVGRDGIHGATFSSAELDESAPRSVVQVGSPITQRLVADFLVEACARGLVRCATDNGAGGLASSVGELAPMGGGARLALERVPLKYPGLQPWEVLLSESQERMTLVVDPARADALFALAAEYEVEATDIGFFESTGRLDVRFDGVNIAWLDLEFLHGGVPRKRMEARWTTPPASPPVLPPKHGEAFLLRLLGDLDVCSREPFVRRYDHEVKGRTIVKPLMGPRGRAPQDAAVVRFGFDDWQGVAVTCGIVPRFGDLDPYAMSAAALDEAVRQAVGVGARLPAPGDAGEGFWSACDNFCVPDSAYDATTNPDGREKLGALVLMCEALADVSQAYGVPMTSGKDSMKNDLRSDGAKISVPPTVLYTVTAQLHDVRRAVTSEFKRPGDLVYLLGETYDELGASCALRLLGQRGDHVPRVRVDRARALYRLVADAHDAGLLASVHDLGDGGLGVALAEACFGGGFGARVDLPSGALCAFRQLYAESCSRFLVSITAQRSREFETLFGDRASRLGAVSADSVLRVCHAGAPLFEVPIEDLERAWSSPLEGAL